MAANPYETYKRQEILSSSRGDLLLMLYDGCIKHLRLARIALAEKDVQGTNNSLVKAQSILSMLMTDLDMSFELSGPLMDLYRYFNQELIEANIHKDDAKIAPVLDMLIDLRNTWQTALCPHKAGIAASR